jgi:hypothetical protein
MCSGVDLSPALVAQGFDARDTIDAIEASCNRGGGSAAIPAEARAQLESVSKILNIGWIADGTARDATIICPRSSNCPRERHCMGTIAPKRQPQIEEIRDQLMQSAADPH